MITDELRIEISADTGNAATNINNTATALDNLGDSAKTADTDMSTLVKAMSDAAANMVQVVDNIAASASNMGSFKDGLDAASSSLQGINIKFDVLNGSIRDSYAAFDIAATSVSNLADSSEKSAGALSGIVSATDGFADRMGELQGNTQNTSDSMASLQRELQETLTSVRGFSDNMSNAGKDAEETSRKIRELSDEVQKLAQKSNSGSMGIAGIAAGFKSLKGIVATLGIGKFIKDSYDAYNVQMQNELKLTAHMKQRMNATDDEVRAIKDLASAQQQLGVIGDEIQLAGAQQLTTYARQSSTLKTLLPAMNNLIAQTAGYDATASDAVSMADALGRALNGQYTSLERMIGKFTDAQKQVLKYGTESQKAAVLADAINSKVGNMNELLAQPATGKFKQLQNDFGDIQEQLGALSQQLLTTFVPIARNMLDILVPPIMNVSKGITVIGQAIASVDSPAVRGIALAAAGVAIVNKLKFALGGTSAGLLLLGVILTGIIGSMQEKQESIGDIVSNAYNSAANAAGSATEAVSDYNDEIANTEKAINRLAGFDTITKLSGGSSKGALVSALLGDNGLDDIYAATSAADDLSASISSVEAEAPKISFSSILDGAAGIAEDLFKALFGTDDEQYAALNRLNDKVKSIFGEPLTEFWKGVGTDIYDIINGDESAIYKGWFDLNEKVNALMGSWWTNNVSPFFQNLGSGFQSVVSGIEKASKGDYAGASDEFNIGWAKLEQNNPFKTEEQKKLLAGVEAYIRNGKYGQADYALDEGIYKDLEGGLKNVVYEAPHAVIDFLTAPLNTSENFGFDIGQTLTDAYDWWVENGPQKLGQMWHEAANEDLYNELYQRPVNTQSTDYRDVPMVSADPAARTPINNYFTVQLDGDEISSKVVTNTDKRTATENGRGG